MSILHDLYNYSLMDKSFTWKNFKIVLSAEDESKKSYHKCLNHYFLFIVQNERMGMRFEPQNSGTSLMWKSRVSGKKFDH